MAVAIVLSVSSCKLQTKDDLGKTVSRTVSMQPFVAIECMNNSNVHYVHSDKYEVIVKAPEAMQQSVRLTVVDQTLFIQEERNGKHHYLFNNDFGKAEIWVKAPTIVSATIEGTGDFDTKDSIIAPYFMLKSSGVGDVTLSNIECGDKLEITANGDGHVVLGKDIQAKTAGIYSEGTGDIDVVGNITAKKVELQTDGPGAIHGNISNANELKLTLNFGSMTLKLNKVVAVTGLNGGLGTMTLDGTAKSCNIRNDGGKLINNTKTF